MAETLECLGGWSVAHILISSLQHLCRAFQILHHTLLPQSPHPALVPETFPGELKEVVLLSCNCFLFLRGVDFDNSSGQLERRGGIP